MVITSKWWENELRANAKITINYRIRNLVEGVELTREKYNLPAHMTFSSTSSGTLSLQRIAEKLQSTKTIIVKILQTCIRLETSNYNHFFKVPVSSSFYCTYVKWKLVNRIFLVAIHNFCNITK